MQLQEPQISDRCPSRFGPPGSNSLADLDPPELIRRRNLQMETFKKAKQNNIPASFSRAQPDKLYVRGKLWPVGQPLVG